MIDPTNLEVDDPADPESKGARRVYHGFNKTWTDTNDTRLIERG
eukprot:CAMPEP_0205909116 /NCGR_PEP_ID=MMETSP1325-20131115/3661_1 /ASSEMBLY_ACC=CAM_ASM_000708 /TAXON_ID=236786 /ORGANISM="Florenciella sp., Strain RCC1007" /LENGTH=43 /DNA_ID= /DNA_START= /DNA_END= /DNA_ORIENTATION=